MAVGWGGVGRTSSIHLHLRWYITPHYSTSYCVCTQTFATPRCTFSSTCIHITLSYCTPSCTCKYTYICCSPAGSLAFSRILLLPYPALSSTSSHTCHAKLAHGHIRVQLQVLRLHSYVSYTTVRSPALPRVLMLSYFTFSSMCTHTHATLLHRLLHLHTYVLVHCCTFCCTCMHSSRATLLYFPLHLHTTITQCYQTSSCTCTHADVPTCTMLCQRTFPNTCLCTFAMPFHVLMRLHTYSCYATASCHAFVSTVGYHAASQPCRKES